MLQQNFITHAIDIAKVEEAGAHQRCHLLWSRQGYRPYRAGLAIRDIQYTAVVERQTVGLCEKGIIIAAIS